jgi:DNA-directed RNA polymerase specialized sigma24 family protein
MEKSEDTKSSDLSNALLKAILLVLIDARENPNEPAKPEILLHAAGLTNKDISRLLQKREAAVRMAISRAK